MSASDKDREAARLVLEAIGGDKNYPLAPVVVASMHVAEAIATARADGYRAGLEAAAKECDERAALNEAIERDDPEYMESIPRMHEARECAASIRALAKEGR